MDGPQISVCMPVRDHHRFLTTSVKSVLAQSNADFELVICDDGSQVPVAPLIGGLTDDRVRVVSHARSQGAAAARNTCLSVAQGRYIGFLDADDILLPGALALQAQMLDRYPSVVLVHGGFQVIDEHGERMRDWEQLFAEDTLTSGASAFAELVLADFITNSTVMVRRSVLDDAGPFATDMGPCGTDWEMWMRVALRGDVAYLAAPLAQYRQHARTISAASSRSGERLRGDLRALRRVRRRERGSIADAPRQWTRARDALVVKAVIAAGDAATRADRRAAVSALLTGVRGDWRLAGEWAAWALLAGHVRRNEFRAYAAGKRVVARRLRRLSGSRFARRYEKIAREDPQWQEQLARAAALVRSRVPASGTVAVIDKWDPTVLHLAGRAGVHFPDRRLMPDGYPADSDAAIAHLEMLRQQGVSHLAVPKGSAWWLEHYDGLRTHLDQRYVKAHGGDECVIYSLTDLVAAPS